MESENDSLYCAQDIKRLIGGYKDIESDFCSNVSLNDNLENILSPFKIISRFDFLVHLFCYTSRYNNMSRYIVKWMNKKSKRLII
jgi:hypothetical protein